MNELDWQKKFNQLFKSINNKETDSYFKGARFIKVIQEFDENFPSYGKYTDILREEGRSTSRKDFFYNILSSFPDNIKYKIIERIYKVIENKEYIT